MIPWAECIAIILCEHRHVTIFDREPKVCVSALVGVPPFLQASFEISCVVARCNNNWG